MKTNVSLGILVTSLLAMGACSNTAKTVDRVQHSQPICRVSVRAAGEVSADGRKVSFHELDSIFTQLKENGGIVWYYREEGGAEPPAVALQVIKLITDKSLPISLSSKSDFSDYVDMNGQSHPRK